MILNEAVEVLDYLNEHPTAAEILAAVHEVKTQSTRLRQFQIDEDDFKGEFNQLPSIWGQFPEKAPDDFRNNFNWAQEQMKRYSKKKAN